MPDTSLAQVERVVVTMDDVDAPEAEADVERNLPRARFFYAAEASAPGTEAANDEERAMLTISCHEVALGADFSDPGERSIEEAAGDRRPSSPSSARRARRRSCATASTRTRGRSPEERGLPLETLLIVSLRAISTPATES